MKATVIRPIPVDNDPSDGSGTWVQNQDPMTGEIVEQWIPAPGEPAPINSTIEVPCEIRGVQSSAYAAGPNREEFGSLYENLEYLQMKYPAKYNITKNDRITNIKDSKGKVIYKDFEFSEDAPESATNTIFNVDGVTPIFDPFNVHIENFALLSRAE